MQILTPEEIPKMRAACQLAAETLQYTRQFVKAGVTTNEIDKIVHEYTLAKKAIPAPLGYHGFPKSVCTSVNEVICHGIPDDRPLRDGDIVNVDVTVYVGGVHGDTDATFAVGTVDRQSTRLIATTKECLERGIEVVRPGRRICEIGQAIEAHAH